MVQALGDFQVAIYNCHCDSLNWHCQHDNWNWRLGLTLGRQNYGLMGKAAALGDPVAMKWVEENCPEKPAWLQAMLEGKGGDEQGATNS